MYKAEASSPANPARQSRSQPPFQFSLFRLMVVVTLVALALGLTTAFGATLVHLFVALVVCVLPTPFVIGAVCGTRDIQAFSIGVLLPWLVLLVSFPGLLFRSISLAYLVGTILVLVLGPVSGIVAVATRRLLERNDLVKQTPVTKESRPNP